MIWKPIFVTALLLSLTLLAVPVATAATRYTPQAGDYFTYYEVTDLANGTGYYEGYTEHTVITGTIEITGVDLNATISARFSYAWNWSSSDGVTDSGDSSGDFTFSSSTFLYVNGTDDQTGYVNPTVWFYIDNTTPQSDSFLLLNTQMTVQDANQSYYLPSQAGYVRTIYALGTSSYQRNDVYGVFTATYDWKAFFDPSTGYIVGYRYAESDEGSGESFTYSENLYVVSTSYQLAPADAPSQGDGETLIRDFIYFGALILILVVVIAIIVALARRRRNIPKHPTQQVSWKQWEDQQRQRYGPPPPPPPDLTPNQQPQVQQIVIKEVAKVYCRYCGALMDSTAMVCPRCGAPRG